MSGEGSKRRINAARKSQTTLSGWPLYFRRDVRATRPLPRLSSTKVDDARSDAQPDGVDIEASARKHGVSDDDMLHALRHHWRGFETDDADVTMFIGPSASGEPLEVGVVDDADGVAIIHAMAARSKFLKGWWTP
jgi:hypothetical protein